MMYNLYMKNLIDKASECHKLSKAEITAILKDKSINEYLFCAADKVRRKYIGDEVYLRALIEFSNICRCNCFYCGLRAENRDVERYRLTRDEILDCAKHAISHGYKTIVLQSGEDLHFSAEALADIIKEIKSNTPRPFGERVELLNEQREFSKSGQGDNVAITLSIGERSFEEYKILKEAGADRFLLRIETTNKNLYAKFHPGQNVENRKRCLYDLKKLGFETGTGSLIGLPGQTEEDLAEDILFYKELNADMIGIGPLITHERTPLAGQPNGDLTLALKVMALTRLLLPDINIPATTAMETLQPNGRILALKAGANVVMPNVTDNAHKKNYEIYPGKVSVDYAELDEKLKQLGRKISTGRGFRSDNGGFYEDRR